MERVPGRFRRWLISKAVGDYKVVANATLTLGPNSSLSNCFFINGSPAVLVEADRRPQISPSNGALDPL